MTSIKNEKILELNINGRTYYGFDQAWYKTGSQRFSGCGPTVSANIIYYLYKNERVQNSNLDLESPEAIRNLMDHVWEYVTPGNMGINSTEMLQNGLMDFGSNNNINLNIKTMDIVKTRCNRYSFDQVSEFLHKSLSNDDPVAFLNLSNGTIQNLESWHWVLLTGLKENTATILDQGKKKYIDLEKWLHTTLLGGGFVSVGIR